MRASSSSVGGADGAMGDLALERRFADEGPASSDVLCESMVVEGYIGYRMEWAPLLRLAELD
jgi:hypothetical protein